jgi:hypothetical protein
MMRFALPQWPLTLGRLQVPGPNGLNPSPTVHTFRHKCQQLEEVCLVFNSLRPSGGNIVANLC